MLGEQPLSSMTGRRGRRAPVTALKNANSVLLLSCYPPVPRHETPCLSCQERWPLRAPSPIPGRAGAASARRPLRLQASLKILGVRHILCYVCSMRHSERRAFGATDFIAKLARTALFRHVTPKAIPIAPAPTPPPHPDRTGLQQYGAPAWQLFFSPNRPVRR